MISHRATSSIDYLFVKSVKTNLVRNESDTCHVTPSPVSDLDKFPHQSILVQTISSFPFRLPIVLHVSEAPATIDYFCRDATEKSLREVLEEYLNLCSGYVNRELLRFFSHIGMSTPYALNKRSLLFLAENKLDLIRSYTISINDSVKLGAMLCISTYGEVDFEVEKFSGEKKEEQEVGELELF